MASMTLMVPSVPWTSREVPAYPTVKESWVWARTGVRLLLVADDGHGGVFLAAGVPVGLLHCDRCDGHGVTQQRVQDGCVVAGDVQDHAAAGGALPEPPAPQPLGQEHGVGDLGREDCSDGAVGDEVADLGVQGLPGRWWLAARTSPGSSASLHHGFGLAGVQASGFSHRTCLPA
jgi:hypothetical protein